MATLTITITDIPEDTSPASLAHTGEAMALEANPPELNPGPKAWMRAGISASQILRFVHEDVISCDLLVALIAGNADPAHDNSTPQREKLIGEHVSLTAM